MGQDRNIAGSLQPKDEILQPRRQQMVRRLKQQVPGIVESESLTLAQLDAKIGGDMHVCAGDKGDRYAGLGNALPQSVNRCSGLQDRYCYRRPGGCAGCTQWC